MGLDGQSLGNGDVLRGPLEAGTGLSFAAPATHSVWRQYKRAFQVGLLVEEADRNIRVTDVCRMLATDDGVLADDYLLLFARRFCLPFPAFQQFVTQATPFFPICAILKLILAKTGDGLFSVDAQQALDYVEGNRCTGLENLDFYAALQPVQTNPQSGDELRQVREMLAFISQMSWLHWQNSALSAASGISREFANGFAQQLQPDILQLPADATTAYLTLTSLDGQIPDAPGPEESWDIPGQFEGNRRIVTHYRIERSRKLRLLLLQSLTQPASCDVCQLHPPAVYPWVDSFLEAHHLLPLASPLTRTPEGTRVTDLRAVCPNCHTAVHSYYGSYLALHDKRDFDDRSESIDVYNRAKQEVRQPTWP